MSWAHSEITVIFNKAITDVETGIRGNLWGIYANRQNESRNFRSASLFHSAFDRNTNDVLLFAEMKHVSIDINDFFKL